jgi:hypothetical protein
VTVGGEPATSLEYFEVLNENRLEGILRLDFASVFNVSLYLLTFAGLYAALRETPEASSATLLAALAMVGVTLWLANHSALSMIHLSDLYAAATTDAARTNLLAVGQAVIASDMWHSTGALMAGILLEGALLLVSATMLRGSQFSRATAYVGILTHGLDFIHILIGLVSVDVGNVLMMIAGPFYLIWFPLLGRDLLRLGRIKRHAYEHETTS